MITSVQNEQVKYVVSLHKNKGRREHGVFLVEGKRFVREAFQRKAPIQRLYHLPHPIESKAGAERETGVTLLLQQATALGILVEEVSEIVMRKMSATEEPQGILAVVEKKHHSWEDLRLRDQGILLILDQIQDPGNLGTILRTALAAGVDQIVLTRGSVDLYNPKVLRSTMGAIFSLTILEEESPEETINFCQKRNLPLVISSMEGSSIYDPNQPALFPFAFVIGNEASGVSEPFMLAATKKISIPMFNQVESLNAAMATGIFLYEWRRQGRFL